MSFFSTPGREGIQHRIELNDPAFISDLHLTDDAPDTLEGFLRFMQSTALKYREGVILGDFFNYWVGDDAAFSVPRVTRALADYARTGRQIYLMQGNRDFLMGETYARLCGATLLADPIVATIGKHTLLLSHGDKWCTNDPGYQTLRRRLRSFWWQWTVLHLPLKKRLSIAEKARNQSRTEKSGKSLEMTDVVDSAFIPEAQTAGADIVIHGHTHRPAVHCVSKSLTRIVLSDWVFENEKCLRGGWLSFENNEPILHGPDAFNLVP